MVISINNTDRLPSTGCRFMANFLLPLEIAYKYNRRKTVLAVFEAMCEVPRNVPKSSKKPPKHADGEAQPTLLKKLQTIAAGIAEHRLTEQRPMTDEELRLWGEFQQLFSDDDNDPAMPLMYEDDHEVEKVEMEVEEVEMEVEDGDENEGGDDEEEREEERRASSNEELSSEEEVEMSEGTEDC